MAQNIDDVIKVGGVVKWFDPTRGYGFILDQETGGDILLHANVLRNFGQSTVADGSGITVLVQNTNRGMQAVEVVQIVPPEGSGGAPIEDLNHTSPESLAELPFLPARVKWFDKIKGFGFANVFGDPADVFLHIEVLHHSGFADLGPGEAIAMRLVDGKRGLMAAQICRWDSVSLDENDPLILSLKDAAQ